MCELCYLILHRHTGRVCYISTSHSGTYAATQAYQQAYTQYYTTSCGWWGYGRCGRSRTAYRTAYRTVTGYQVNYQSTAQCCAGYSGSPPNCPRKYRAAIGHNTRGIATCMQTDRCKEVCMSGLASLHVYRGGAGMCHADVYYVFCSCLQLSLCQRRLHCS